MLDTGNLSGDREETSEEEGDVGLANGELGNVRDCCCGDESESARGDGLSGAGISPGLLVSENQRNL